MPLPITPFYMVYSEDGKTTPTIHACLRDTKITARLVSEAKPRCRIFIMKTIACYHSESIVNELPIVELKEEGAQS